jgi:hypothetical protein
VVSVFSGFRLYSNASNRWGWAAKVEVPKVSTVAGFHCEQDSTLAGSASSILYQQIAQKLRAGLGKRQRMASPNE